MAIKNLGNFKRTVGVYVMKLDNGIELEFETGFDGEDMFNFGEVLQLPVEQKVRGMAKFIVDFLDKKKQFEPELDDNGDVIDGTSWTDADKSKWVVTNIMPFMKAFMIMFDVTDAETFDKVMNKEIDKKLKSPSQGAK